jgi:hypothetical protein
MMTVRHTFRALMLIAAAAAVPVTVSAQSLGELAKQEEARRKAIKSSGKVYTNETIRSEAAPAQAVPQPAATPAPPGAATPAAPDAAPAPDDPANGAAAAAASGGKRDETYWKKRIVAARDALDRSQTFAEALQSRINALTTDFASRDDPAQRAVVAADRQKALIELERVKQEIQQQTKAIAAVQEEARRAGVPPGWLR